MMVEWIGHWTCGQKVVSWTYG